MDQWKKQQTKSTNGNLKMRTERKKKKTTKIRIETNFFALLETNVCNQRMPVMEMERTKAVSFLVQKDFGMEMHVAEEIVAQEKTWKVRH
jgi:hypothetical protein